MIPAELRVDLSKYPQFTLAAAANTGAGADGADSGAGDDCVLIPEDVNVGDGDDDPFSPEAIAAAERDCEEVDDATARERLRMYTPHKFILRIPPGQTLATDFVFQPTTARAHRFTLPVIIPGLSVSESLQRVVSAEGLEPRLRTSIADADNTVDFQFRVVQRDAVRRVPYKLAFTITNVDSAAVQWAVDTSALKSTGVLTWAPVSGEIAAGVSAVM